MLGRVLGMRRRAVWPRQIDGLHVELVDTVAGLGIGRPGPWPGQLRALAAGQSLRAWGAPFRYR